MSEELRELVRQLDESVKRTQAKIELLKRMLDDEDRTDYLDMLDTIENTTDWNYLNNIKDTN
jgi:hypothetical protein|tara:strand:- start:264 stop:449 length:186 start_codon:yes stop_codon:yes gene_type:complete